MKKLGFLVLAFTVGITTVAVSMSDVQAQSPQCHALARRVASYRNIRNNYLQQWRQCNWQSGSYAPRCQRLRHAVNRWYGHVNSARASYRAWGCTFRWGRWNDPWAPAPVPVVSQHARCNNLANTVANYRNIRNNYLQRWRQCNWQSGSYAPRCQRLRDAVNRWYGHVNSARVNYRAWGCTFHWGVWNDPWAPAPTPVVTGSARCNALANTVANYRNIRSNYIQQWSQCNWESGSYSRRCRRLRRAVNRWSGHVNTARANYRAWGCTFRWGRWNDPWR